MKTKDGILDLLQHKVLSEKDICVSLNKSPSTISEHLLDLVNRGKIVAIRLREGSSRIYFKLNTGI